MLKGRKKGRRKERRKEKEERKRKEPREIRKTGMKVKVGKKGEKK